MVIVIAVVVVGMVIVIAVVVLGNLLRLLGTEDSVQAD